MSAIVYHETRGRPRRLKVDPRPGNYYVCAVDAGRVAFVAGPFRYHRQARRFYRKAKAAALAADPWAWFYQWGTCRTEHGRVRGALNESLGIRGG